MTLAVDGPQKATLTLLADDQGRLATGDEARHFLKAHLVQQALTNTSITVPDSFLINNANLRALLRDDETVQGLVRHRILCFAVRDTVLRHSAGLISLATSFREKGSLRDSVQDAATTELRFVDVNAKVLSWKIADVAANYAALSRKALFSPRTDDVLRAPQAALLRRIINDDRGGQIDRNLIYFEIEDLFERHNAPLSPTQLAHLRLCVDAPYHSNLPSLLALDPAYDEQTRASFELMRGLTLTATELDGAREMPDRLDAKHYVYGLTQLPLDAILTHRDSFEFKAFIQAMATKANPDDVEDTFFHNDVAIQTAILAQFPDLQARSSIVAKRKISKKVHEFRKDGVSRLTDVVSIGMSVAGLSLPAGIGFCANHLVDYVRGHASEAASKRPLDDIATYEKEKRRLRRYLQDKGLDAKISQSQSIIETQSHSVETFVAQT